MIELQLSTHAMSRPIVIYDGHVIEFFFDDLTNGSRRVHVGHIKSIEILPVGRGKEKYQLQIKGEYMLVAIDVSEAVLPKAQEMVAAMAIRGRARPMLGRVVIVAPAARLGELRQRLFNMLKDISGEFEVEDRNASTAAEIDRWALTLTFAPVRPSPRKQ